MCQFVIYDDVPVYRLVMSTMLRHPISVWRLAFHLLGSTSSNNLDRVVIVIINAADNMLPSRRLYF